MAKEKSILEYEIDTGEKMNYLKKNYYDAICENSENEYSYNQTLKKEEYIYFTKFLEFIEREYQDNIWNNGIKELSYIEKSKYIVINKLYLSERIFLNIWPKLQECAISYFFNLTLFPKIIIYKEEPIQNTMLKYQKVIVDLSEVPLHRSKILEIDFTNLYNYYIDKEFPTKKYVIKGLIGSEEISIALCNFHLIGTLNDKVVFESKIKSGKIKHEIESFFKKKYGKDVLNNIVIRNSDLDNYINERLLDYSQEEKAERKNKINVKRLLKK